MVPGVLLSKAYKHVLVVEWESSYWAWTGDTDVYISYWLSGERVAICSWDALPLPIQPNERIKYSGTVMAFMWKNKDFRSCGFSAVPSCPLISKQSGVRLVPFPRIGCWGSNLDSVVLLELQWFLSICIFWSQDNLGCPGPTFGSKKGWVQSQIRLLKNQ